MVCQLDRKAQIVLRGELFQASACFLVHIDRLAPGLIIRLAQDAPACLLFERLVGIRLSHSAQDSLCAFRYDFPVSA